MNEYGIGYGQVEDFKAFLRARKAEDFEELSKDRKKALSSEFLMMGQESIVSAPKQQIKKSVVMQKPSLESFYAESIRPKFNIEELVETCHFEVFIVVSAKNGWLLQVVTTSSTVEFPFITRENCEKVIGFIWKDLQSAMSKKTKIGGLDE